MNYATADTADKQCNIPKTGNASSLCDYDAKAGSLNFAVGETSKTISIPLVDDSYAEGNESFTITLRSAAGNGSVLGSPAKTTVIITDNDTINATNPIDDPVFFVRQQYRDFLNREPDASGENFWTDNITRCSDPNRRPPGQTEAKCIDRQRDRFYKGALGRQPKLSEFTPDAQFVAAGIIVNNQLSAAQIEANKSAYANLFVGKPEFLAIYGALTNQQYVDKLFETTTINASAADRTALVNGLNNGTETRATVLKKIVDGTVVISEGNQQFTTSYGQAFYNLEFNRAFVLMEYFGYLRRDPDAAGYAYWLSKLNQFGNYLDAEMVKAFIISPEYRSRFGQP